MLKVTKCIFKFGVCFWGSTVGFEISEKNGVLTNLFINNFQTDMFLIIKI